MVVSSGPLFYHNNVNFGSLCISTVLLVTLAGTVTCQDGEIAKNITITRQTSNGSIAKNQSIFSEKFTSNVSVPLSSPISRKTSFQPRSTSCMCGMRVRGSAPSGKIVGGTPILDNEHWPWFATLIHLDRPTIAHCGASLISPRYVLTAAHCLHTMMQLGLRHFRVVMGSSDLENQNRPPLQVIIESVTIHPKFEQSFPYHYDIGLIKLLSPVNCSSMIRPICLPYSSLLDEFTTLSGSSISLQTAGFGRQSVSGNHSSILRQIDINLVSNSDCQHNFSKLSFKGPEIMDNMLCAWSKGKDSCVGDSGGPLILPISSHPTKHIMARVRPSLSVQVGIISWGIGCANERYPGVYTRIDKYISWIKSIVLDL